MLKVFHNIIIGKVYKNQLFQFCEIDFPNSYRNLKSQRFSNIKSLGTSFNLSAERFQTKATSKSPVFFISS